MVLSLWGKRGREHIKVPHCLVANIQKSSKIPIKPWFLRRCVVLGGREIVMWHTPEIDAGFHQTLEVYGIRVLESDPGHEVCFELDLYPLTVAFHCKIPHTFRSLTIINHIQSPNSIDWTHIFWTNPLYTLILLFHVLHLFFEVPTVADQIPLKLAMFGHTQLFLDNPSYFQLHSISCQYIPLHLICFPPLLSTPTVIRLHCLQFT